LSTNILKALLNLSKLRNNDIVEFYKSSIRIQQAGDVLEYYVKDLLCNTANINDLKEKEKIYSEHFSYGGNSNNPPDLMIKEGDALEIKKIELIGSGIALNSSYPKAKLHSDSSLITKACRECEDWEIKDIIYSVGLIQEKKLKLLWFVYGDCYAADREVYERISNKISAGLNELNGVELSKTNELGRVNKVDPLGITYLRIRGMWGIENPKNVFCYVASEQEDKEFNAFLLMKKDKYLNFPKEDIASITADGSIIKEDVKIKDPNNTAQFIDAVLLKISF